LEVSELQKPCLGVSWRFLSFRNLAAEIFGGFRGSEGLPQRFLVVSEVGLILLIFNILQYISNTAIQNEAQSVERLYANWRAVLHPMKDVSRETVLENKLIFCYPFV
jgi:hypothetical protein